MPRSAETAMRVRGPFGGMLADVSAGNVGPADAAYALNTNTRFGDIRRRPGSRVLSPTGSSVPSGTVGVLDTATVRGVKYLYQWVNTSPSQHRLFSQTQAEFVLNRGSAAIKPGRAMAYNVLYLPQGPVGDSTKVWRTGSTFGWARIGIVAPTAAPAFVGPAVGVIPAGTYSYRYTWYNANTATESGPSPEGEYTNGADFQIGVLIPARVDLQVTHARIYRRRNTVDTTWYLVGSFDASGGAGSFGDNNYPITQSFSTQIPLISTVPPDSADACFWKSRMWWPVGYQQPIDVRPSEPFRPEIVNPLTGYRIGDELDGWVVKLMVAPSNDALYVFKQYGTYAIYGQDSFSVERVARIGSGARDSVVEHEGVIYFASQRGIYAANGGSFEYLSGPIESLWANYEPSLLGFAVGGFEPHSGCYVFSARVASTGAYTQPIAYDVSRGTWQLWSLPISAMAQHAWEEEPRRQLYAALGNAYTTPSGFVEPNGRLFFFERSAPGDFDDKPMAMRWTTGKLELGRHREKVTYYLTLEFDRPAVSTELSVFCAVDEGASELLETFDLRDHAPRRVLRLGRRGHTFQFTLEAALAATDIRLRGYTIEADLRGEQ